MNLSDVIKTNKKFRRPSFKPYNNEKVWLQKDVGGVIVFANTANAWNPRAEDITADDWITEEDKRSFTLQEILASVQIASRRSYTDYDFETQLGMALGFYEDETRSSKTFNDDEDLPF